MSGVITPEPSPNSGETLLEDPFSRQMLLEDASARFGETFDVAGAGTVLISPSGGILRANRAFSSLVGRDGETLAQDRWQSIAHPDDARLVELFMERTLAGRDDSLSAEVRLVRLDGKTVHVLLIASLVRDEEEVPLYFFCQMFDITERKLIEDQHRTKSLLIQLMQEVTVAGSRAPDPDQVLRETMRAVCSYMGWSLAHVYRVLEDGQAISTGLWEPADSSAFEEFKAFTEKMHIPTGEGLPGRVFVSREPAWVEDLLEVHEFPRRDLALNAGLRSAFAIPVIVEERVDAVMEFFSMTQQDARPAVVEIMEQIGRIVGQTRERKSVELSLQEERERMRQVLETANDAFIEMDTSGMVTGWNRKAMDMFGWSRQEILGRELCETIIPPAFREAHRKGLKQFLETGQGPVLGRTLEVSALKRDGTEIPVELTIWPTRVDDRYRFNAFIRDIGERQAAAEALQKANEELQTWVEELERRNREILLLNHMSEMLQTCESKEEAHAVVADFTERLFAGTEGFLGVREPQEDLVDVVGTWGRQTHVHNFSRRDCWALRRGREYVVDGRGVRCAHVRDPDASYVCMPLTAQGETFGVLHIRKGEEGSVDPATDEYRRLLGTVVDQVAMILVNLELRESHEDLHLQSIRDPVTDLFNRRYMEESLDRELKRASRAGQQLGLIMIDIDHFKQINDTHGHDVGDSVLSALGEFLKGRIRGEDIACRFGGEEFMLILPEATPEVTKERALEIVAEFKSIRINDGKGGVPTPTLSAGVATFPDDGTNRNAIIRVVDEMLYQAKEQGRDRVVAAHEAF